MVDPSRTQRQKQVNAPCHRILENEAPGTERAKVAYVGDETRDVNAARRVEIQTVAVTWGMNTRRAFEPFEPDYLFDEPGELLSLAGDASSA